MAAGQDVEAFMHVPYCLLQTGREGLALFHCKHVERQLSSSWLSQQATKALAATKDFSASYGLRQRMLHFLHNIEHYMMFEVRTEIAALLPTSSARRCAQPPGRTS